MSASTCWRVWGSFRSVSFTIVVMNGVMQLAGVTSTCMLTGANACHLLGAGKCELGFRPTAGGWHGGLPNVERVVIKRDRGSEAF